MFFLLKNKLCIYEINWFFFFIKYFLIFNLNECFGIIVVEYIYFLMVEFILFFCLYNE